MERKQQQIKRIKFGKVKYMCGACRKSVSVAEDQIVKMQFCPYCGEKKKEIKQ